MGQGLAKVNRAKNRVRAVIAGPPLVVSDGGKVVVKEMGQKDEPKDINEFVLAYPATKGEYCGLELSLEHLTMPILQPYLRSDLQEELAGYIIFFFFVLRKTVFRLNDVL